jgi:hypothetical protein
MPSRQCMHLGAAATHSPSMAPKSSQMTIGMNGNVLGLGCLDFLSQKLIQTVFDAMLQYRGRLIACARELR